jgi:hypothetical protein
MEKHHIISLYLLVYLLLTATVYYLFPGFSLVIADLIFGDAQECIRYVEINICESRNTFLYYMDVLKNTLLTSFIVSSIYCAVRFFILHIKDELYKYHNTLYRAISILLAVIFGMILLYITTKYHGFVLFLLNVSSPESTAILDWIYFIIAIFPVTFLLWSFRDYDKAVSYWKYNNR